MASRRPLLALLAAAALALPAGCGPEEAATAEGGSIRVTLDDFSFDPQRIRTEPGTFRVNLRNQGRLAHTFRLRFQGRVVAAVPSLLPRERADESFQLKRGSYRIFCALSNHEELGMYGTLVVE